MYFNILIVFPVPVFGVYYGNGHIPAEISIFLSLEQKVEFVLHIY